MTVAGWVVLGQISLDFHDDSAKALSVSQPPNQQFTQQSLGHSLRAFEPSSLRAFEKSAVQGLGGWQMQLEFNQFF